MMGIPETLQGQEVVVQFFAQDIQNGGYFYTDSNGLEMQERQLDHRPTWDLKTRAKVPSNYYPVCSAIAIRDLIHPWQMTVLPDRSQGGSSLRHGRIELMQNRRLYYDDDKGLDEPLDETNKKDGLGITVPATYRVQLFDYKATPSF